MENNNCIDCILCKIKLDLDYENRIKQYHRLYSKNYYRLNRDKILKKSKIKFDCKCGGRYTKNHKSMHLKTKKHLNWIKNNI